MTTSESPPLVQGRATFLIFLFGRWGEKHFLKAFWNWVYISVHRLFFKGRHFRANTHERSMDAWDFSTQKTHPSCMGLVAGHCVDCTGACRSCQRYPLSFRDAHRNPHHWNSRFLRSRGGLRHRSERVYLYRAGCAVGCNLHLGMRVLGFGFFFRICHVESVCGGT